jgi:hypothetical protein
MDETEQNIGALRPEATFELSAQPRQVVHQRRRHGHQIGQSRQPQQAAGQRQAKARSGGRGCHHPAHQQRIVARQTRRVLTRRARSVALFGVGDDPAELCGRGPADVHSDH